MGLNSFKFGRSGHGTSWDGTSLRSRVQFAAALVLVVGLVGCQSINMNSAQIRVVDATTYPGAIDSYQDDTALAYNLAHGTATTYVTSASGSSTFSLDRAGTRQALTTLKSTPIAGRQYTEIVTGTLVNMQTAVLEDQSTPASAGHAAIRLINEAPGAGRADIYLVSRGASGTAFRLATNPALGANAAYIEISAGTYALDIVSSGANPSSAIKLFSGPQIDYASGAVRTIVLIDTRTPMPEAVAPARSVQAISLDDADTL